MKKAFIFILSLLLLASCAQESVLDLSSYGDSSDGLDVTDLNDTLDLVNNSALSEVEDETNNSSELKDNSNPKADVDKRVLTYVEGDKIVLNPKVSDPDGDDVDVTFYPPFDENGEWVTKLGDAGEHDVYFTISDGFNVNNVTLTIMLQKRNRAPVLNEIEDIEVDEGDLIEIDVEVNDPENDPLTIEYDGFMSSKSYQTTYLDAGDYTQKVIVSDGENTVETSFDVIINDVNQPPVFTGKATYNVLEGDSVDLNISFEDIDNDDVSYELPEELSNEVFEAKIGELGKKEFTLKFTDGNFEEEKTLIFNIGDVNFPPVLKSVNGIEYSDDLKLVFEEGKNASLELVSEDLDGDKITYSFKGFFKSNSKEINFDDAGEYVQEVVLSDGENSVTYDFDVVIEDVNRPPVFVGFD